MSQPSAFRSPQGEAKFRAAYDDTLKLWPVAPEELDIPTHFGMTHVIVTGPQNAPAVVLLHGYMATSVMWGPNVADFAGRYRVYAVDVMGQPGKSIPGEPIRCAADYIAWLTETFDALGLHRPFLVGMSFGGWLALTFAIAAPSRVSKLVLLSPGGLLPMARQFRLRGMLMALLPMRLTVSSFMRWAGFTGPVGAIDATCIIDLMYLGQKHFRMPRETLRVAASAAAAVSDHELRGLRMPVLLLMGEGDPLCDTVSALGRATRLISDVEGDLIPQCRHDMCFSRYRIVDARICAFLDRGGQDVAGITRSVA